MAKLQTSNLADPSQRSNGSGEAAPQWGELLWSPSKNRIRQSNIARFMAWLERERGLRFASYDELWRWSVTEIEAFWTAIWDHFDVEAAQRYTRVLSSNDMPGARWFEGARLNFAQHALRQERRTPDETAIYAFSEERPMQEITWSELGESVRKLATALRNLGIKPGDRVISYLPNTTEAAIALLAATAIGAVFASASPEFGSKTVIDRFGQLEPKLIFASSGYRFNGACRDRRENLEAIIDGLPSLEHAVLLPFDTMDIVRHKSVSTHTWPSLMKDEPPPAADFQFEQVSHDHPLWVLFSSGTTGLPKAIIHSHAGILLEHLKSEHFTAELKPNSTLFFYTTTSWMVWNTLFCSLLTGASIVIYDGSPVYPDSSVLWRMAEEAGVTALGMSPGLVNKMDAEGIRPGDAFDLSRLEMIILGGAPSTPETFQWFYNHVAKDLWVTSQTGGTDLCGTIAGGVALAPVYAGEIQGRALGINVDCWSPSGKTLRNETGELVIRSPSPSMPIGFWNDEDGERYRNSYFSSYPGTWQQGDLCLINDRGGVYIFGRSDATLNRHGVRIGTAEIYRTLEGIPGVADSLAVCVGEQMILFVQTQPEERLSDQLTKKIRDALRQENSPRHVPDRIIGTPAIPYTLTGKRMEVPVRRLLEGEEVQRVADPQMMREPKALEWYVDLAMSFN
ncbi:acetoacetate--CoA ligase [Henriciella aquimarina]|uniref:acetoacetate--CoA ligase n=1 Tax=Henriciella aquimarina TaxID=545261 RepID=UPI001F3D6B86|nr:acetoacetate--CoA ligase [Henriciella aquimarina]